MGSPAGSPVHGFSDVPGWVAAPVSWLTDPVNVPPFATGWSDGTFRPDGLITRAQAARMLHRMRAELGA